MSAKYKCDFCGKKLNDQSWKKEMNFSIHKKLYKSEELQKIRVRFVIATECNSGNDICENCIEEVKQEAGKRMAKLKIIGDKK